MFFSSMPNIGELCTSAEIDLHNPDVIASSRKATALLRHNALTQRLMMDDGGWVPIGLLAKRAHRSVGAMIVIAAADPKGRFQLAHHRVNDEPRTAMLIRATQGHSISSILDGRLFVRPHYDDVRRWPFLVHATHYECVLDILRKGLLPGGARWSAEESRNHVHFVPFEPEDYRVVSGTRRSAKAFLFFNKWAVFSHCDLWLTPSMAILTRDGVPWSDLEIILLYSGSNSDRRVCLRRTIYDAAMAHYAVEEPSDFARQIFQRNHPLVRGTVGSAAG
ncbi:MAG: RNA 2'-phosphotransferase, partial [bacterium]|nr:RNA 2'-phosphotransferase [bacterium]